MMIELASWRRVLERSFVPLVVVAAALGLAARGAGRSLGDHHGINGLLIVLVFVSTLGVEPGVAARIEAIWQRFAITVVVVTAALAAGSWAAGYLVTDSELRHGVFALGVAPAEIATIALTRIAGGDAAVAALNLLSSTVVSVVIAGPVLALEAGAGVAAVEVLRSLLAIVALPLVAGLLLGRKLRAIPLVARNLEPCAIVTVIALVWLVASQVTPARAYLGVVAAIAAFIVWSTACGAVVARFFPPAAAPGVFLSVAVRDFAVASGIATSAFGARAAGPLGVYGVLVIGWGALLARSGARRLLGHQ